MSSYKTVYKHGHVNAGADGRILEHVFIMSELLGRPLTDLEVVHHVDEDKGNNAPKNLQLFATVTEHNSHHRHLRAMQDCGNPEYRKCAFCKTYDNPEDMVQRRAGGSVAYHHKACVDFSNAEKRSTPEGKEYVKAANAKRNSTPEGRAKTKVLNDARRATPEGKAKANAATAASRAKKKLLLTQLEKQNHEESID